MEAVCRSRDKQSNRREAQDDLSLCTWGRLPRSREEQLKGSLLADCWVGVEKPSKITATPVLRPLSVGKDPRCIAAIPHVDHSRVEPSMVALPRYLEPFVLVFLPFVFNIATALFFVSSFSSGRERQKNSAHAGQGGVTGVAAPVPQ